MRTAWGMRTQATNYQNEALAARATAGAINPGMSAASSLLTSAGHVASSWYGQGSYLVMAGNDVVRTHGGAPFILKVGE